MYGGAEEEEEDTSRVAVKEIVKSIESRMEEEDKKEITPIEASAKSEISTVDSQKTPDVDVNKPGSVVENLKEPLLKDNDSMLKELNTSMVKVQEILQTNLLQTKDSKTSVEETQSLFENIETK